MLSANTIVNRCVSKVGSISELSKLTGYAHQTLRNWAYGKVQPPFRGVLDCCQAVGWTIEVRTS